MRCSLSRLCILKPGAPSSHHHSHTLSAHLHEQQEFREIHRPYPVAWRQLAAYYIGDLEGAAGTAAACSLTSSASVAQLGALAGGGGGGGSGGKGLPHSQSAPSLEAAARGGQQRPVDSRDMAQQLQNPS